jgi:4-amino-4-deoxy-L-arabinose transferase-like glycosyltransferase
MSRVPTAALVLVLAAYLLPLVSPAPLMEDDEGLHAAIAQEMVERGDWTVPRLLGQPFLDKPILYFWLQAASIAAFGANEFAVRLPGTLVALAGAAALGWMMRAMFGTPAGAWAAIVYATMLLPFAVSLAPLHDLVMVPLVTVAIGAFWHARHADSNGALAHWTGVAAVALGLSVLGKGLTGVGLVGVAIVTWLAWTRAISVRLVVAGAVAVAIALAVAWPWYAAMERAVPGYLHYFLMERHVGGLTEDTQRHAGRPFLYYLPVVLAGGWPWVLFLVRKRLTPLDDRERLLWCWLVADVVLLSLAGSKLATYVLPAMPALAALCTLRVLQPPASDVSSRGWQMAAVGAAVLTILVPVTALTTSWVGSGWPDPPLSVLAWLYAPIALLSLYLRGDRREQWDGPMPLAIMTAVTLLVAALVALPVAAERFTARPLAAQVNMAGQLPTRLLVVDEGVGSFIFYLRPELRRALKEGDVARVSRFSLGDTHGPAGTEVAIAADRVPGVAELYEFGGDTRPPIGTFMIRPLTDFRRRPES